MKCFVGLEGRVVLDTGLLGIWGGGYCTGEDGVFGRD